MKERNFLPVSLILNATGLISDYILLKTSLSLRACPINRTVVTAISSSPCYSLGDRMLPLFPIPSERLKSYKLIVFSFLTSEPFAMPVSIEDGTTRSIVGYIVKANSFHRMNCLVPIFLL